jgi:hypothetical protein
VSGGTGPAALPGLFSPVDAVVTGVATAVWYALPDHVAARRQRMLVKATLLGASAGWSLVSRPDPVLVADLPAPPPRADRSRRERAARAVVAGLVTAGAVAALVGFEVGTYRLGERSARRGVRLPHTRGAVVLGAVSTSAALAMDRAWRRWPPAQLAVREGHPPS